METNKNSLAELSKKRRVSDELGEINIYDFDGTDLNEAIALLENLRPDEEDGYTNVRVVVDTNFYDDDDGYAILTVKADRDETDAEVNKRLELHSKMELDKYMKTQKAIEDEKAKYLELKNKYEKELG